MVKEHLLQLTEARAQARGQMLAELLILPYVMNRAARGYIVREVQDWALTIINKCSSTSLN